MILENLQKQFLTYSKNSPYFEEASLLNKSTDFIRYNLKHPVEFNPINLGPKINGPGREYFPFITADEQTMIFTSRRKLKEKADDETGKQPKDPIDFKYFEDIYISKKKKDGTWGEPKLISNKINTDGHEATIGLSVVLGWIVFVGTRVSITCSVDEFESSGVLGWMSFIHHKIMAPNKTIPINEVKSNFFCSINCNVRLSYY